MLRRTGHLIVGNADGTTEGPRSMCLVESATFRLPDAGMEWNQEIVLQCCSPTHGPQSRPGCEEAKTWSEARDACESYGQRLCTEAEVMSGGGRGKGCGFDKSHTWVSEDCNPAHPTCADINGDGNVDGSDMGLLLSQWGPCSGECPGDLNNDGIVDGADFGQFLALWGPCP